MELLPLSPNCVHVNTLVGICRPCTDDILVKSITEVNDRSEFRCPICRAQVRAFIGSPRQHSFGCPADMLVMKRSLIPPTSCLHQQLWKLCRALSIQNLLKLHKRPQNFNFDAMPRSLLGSALLYLESCIRGRHADCKLQNCIARCSCGVKSNSCAVFTVASAGRECHSQRF